MDLDEVRRANLRNLAKEMGAAELSRKLGYRQPSFITQLSGPNPSRRITEKSARSFEKSLGLETGWFDVDHGEATAPEAPAPVNQTDMLVGIITLVGTVLQNESLTLPPAKFADLVALAVVDSAEHGGAPREAHIKSLVRLMK